MAPTCLIRQDPPGEKFFEESIISVAHNRFGHSEEHEEETSIASENLPDLVPSSEPFEVQQPPSDVSIVPIAQGRSFSKFDPATMSQTLVDNHGPIDDSSRTSNTEVYSNVFVASSDVQVSLVDSSLIHDQTPSAPVLDSSILSPPKSDDSSCVNDQDTISEGSSWVKPIDDPDIANVQDILVNDVSPPMDVEMYKADPFVMPMSSVLQDASLISHANYDVSDRFSSDANQENIVMCASEVPSSPRKPVDPSLIRTPETFLDSSLISQPKKHEPMENPSVSSEANSDEIAWVAPIDYPSGNIEEIACLEDHVMGNDEALNLNEVSELLDSQDLTSNVLYPSMQSHHANREPRRDPSIIHARDFPLNYMDDDTSKSDPSFIHAPKAIFEPSVLSQPNYDSPVFHQIGRNDNDDGLNGSDYCVGSSDIKASGSPSNISSKHGDSNNVPRSSENSGLESSWRSNTSDLSGSVRCSGSVRASDYFERTIIEEYNLRIEEEQRDCSLVTMPVVAAVYDDATTILVRPPPTAVANPNASQSGRQLNPKKQLMPPPRKATLAVPQLKKLRQEYGLPTGVVLEMGEFQRIACTFFVCDTNEVEEDCIKECAQLAGACQSQAIFCYGTYQQEILYPPAKLANGKMPRAVPVLNHCAAVVRNSGRYRTTKETTMKLMEIAQRIPSFDRWPSEKVAVTIITDRTFYSEQEDDKEFVGVIRSLVKLGARVVIRLSTSQRDVVSYYKYLKQTFSPLTILFSFEYQMRLVHHFNPWLNYGAPLHRARELGFSFHRTVEFLGKMILNVDHLREFFVTFHGKKAMVLAPDIHSQWSDFYAFLKKINQKEGKHRLGLDSNNKNRRDFWIDLKHFDRMFKNENEELARRSMPRQQRGSFSQFLRVEI
jgi:hypothetical protein